MIILSSPSGAGKTTLVKMLSKLGWQGYGIYWALVERLRNEPSYTLECDYECLSYALRCDKNIIKSIVLDFNLGSIFSIILLTSL